MTRILFLGNEDTIGSQNHMLLETQGDQLLCFANLQKAIAQILDDPPDLLLVEKGYGHSADKEVIRAAQSCMQKSNMPIILIIEAAVLPSLDWKEYPVDDIILLPVSPLILIPRIRLAESRLVRVFDNNPLSRLPGNTSIIKAINRVLPLAESYGVCYVDIDTFTPYQDRDGYSSGDEVSLMVARLIVNVVEELARSDSFIGHVGGDDFVFIVRREIVEQVCERVLANFNVVRNMFISPEDIQAGEFVGKDRLGNETRFDLLSISIAVISTEKGKYEHYGEVTATASQLKNYVKKKKGSNYMIDRRDGYVPEC